MLCVYCRLPTGFTEFFRVLPSFTGFYRVLLSFVGSVSNFLVTGSSLPSFLLPGYFFYLVLLPSLVLFFCLPTVGCRRCWTERSAATRWCATCSRTRASFAARPKRSAGATTTGRSCAAPRSTWNASASGSNSTTSSTRSSTRFPPPPKRLGPQLELFSFFFQISERQERQIRQAMAQRAGLLPLLLHSTFDHQLQAQLQQQQQQQQQQLQGQP